MIYSYLAKRFLLVSFVCALATISCSPRAGREENDLPDIPFTEDLQESIEQVLQTYPDYDLGISAAVMMPGHQPWAGVSGHSHQSVPITPDMLFAVGSIQKNFEAALVLKLAEDDFLSLDDPVSQYLPKYPNVDERVTVRQLLNHTSGIFNVFEHPDFPWVKAEVDFAREWKEEEVFDTFVLDPYGPPGYVQHYSSTNYLLLTSIIENVTGSTVPAELGRYFLQPMKLDETFVSMGAVPPDKFAVAHPWVDMDRDGTLDDLHGIPLTWIASLTHPVMFSTPRDLVDWIHALFHEGTVIGSESMVEMLTYPETTLRDPDGGSYGLGVVDYSYVRGTRAFGHMGSMLGYSAAALYMPEYGVSVAWMINTGQSPADLSGYLMYDAWSALSRAIERDRGIP